MGFYAVMSVKPLQNQRQMKPLYPIVLKSGGIV